MNGDILRHLGLEPRSHGLHFKIIRLAMGHSFQQVEIFGHVVDEGVGAKVDPVQNDVDRTDAVGRIKREGPGQADLALKQGVPLRLEEGRRIHLKFDYGHVTSYGATGVCLRRFGVRANASHD
ncbi:MAG: hypothetical protein ACOH2H_22480 [Cypionkella sp.]